MEIDSIEWHEKNVINQLDFKNRLIENLKRLKQELFELEDKTDFYIFQIAEAKRKKKVKFDSSKYCVKKTHKTWEKNK